MCGIIGAVAGRHITPILLEGLKRLEYRGYDSAGLAVIETGAHTITCLRTLGKVDQLREEVQKNPMRGSIGIAHTRWATHGQPSEYNAHPHCSEEGRIAVVHNGIIENHDTLRTKLQGLGYTFITDTDSEVIVYLLDYYMRHTTSFVEAIHDTTRDLIGAYALGIISLDAPQTLYGVRYGSPLVIGVGIEEHFIASDPLALLPVTQTFIHLADGDIAEITADRLSIFDKQGQPVTRPLHTTDLDLEATSKGQYRHYMQKEIFEQPDAIIETIHQYIVNNHINIHSLGPHALEILQKTESIYICACGSSYHAGLVAKHWLESLAHIPCQVEVASEFRYREVVVAPHSLFVGLSQSGETADTLSALRTAQERGFEATLGICNVPESALTREADLLFLTRAGTEIGVAATKTFTAQLVGLLILTISLMQIKNPENPNIDLLLEAITHLPKLVNETLLLDQPIQQWSHDFTHKKNAIFLGRGIQQPIAQEGALKLKEISYIHAEAYPAGELKHGPLALIDKNMPVIIVMPKNALTKKLESNIQEVQARQGEVYLFMDETIDYTPKPGTHIIKMPQVSEWIAPIIYSIALQLLAYHVAVQKGTDVDQPRNLAKSVTVE